LPGVSPEQGVLTIADFPEGMFLDKWYVPPSRVPDVGALYFVLHPDPVGLLSIWRVFVFPELGPYFCGGFDPSPPDFSSHCVVEFSRVTKAQASERFWFADFVPADQSPFFVWVVTMPEEVPL
jgi:hypothetical protein